jgi:hypothetical protein
VRKKSEPCPAAHATTAVLFYHNNAAAGKIVSFKDSLILNMIQIPHLDTFVNGDLNRTKKKLNWPSP